MNLFLISSNTETVPFEVPALRVESLVVILTLLALHCVLLCLYPPPKKKKNKAQVLVLAELWPKSSFCVPLSIWFPDSMWILPQVPNIPSSSLMNFTFSVALLVVFSGQSGFIPKSVVTGNRKSLQTSFY